MQEIPLEVLLLFGHFVEIFYRVYLVLVIMVFSVVVVGTFFWHLVFKQSPCGYRLNSLADIRLFK